MPQVGFEPTMSVFERAETVHPLNSVATVLGNQARSFLKEIKGLKIIYWSIDEYIRQ
jgi:hypothetical protein